MAQNHIAHNLYCLLHQKIVSRAISMIDIKKKVPLGLSPLTVAPVCLGTMVFGQQVDEATSFAIIDRALEQGIDFMDAAEMYPVPARAETQGETENIIGRYFQRHKNKRQHWLVATKVAGPGMGWVRGGAPAGKADIITACDQNLKRLQLDVIDLYQIHWPSRLAPRFGSLYYNPAADQSARQQVVDHMHDQLQGLQQLIQAGKVRAIGLSNETPYGVQQCITLAEQHGLPRVASVQNPYCLLNRTVENGLDETMDMLQVGLLAYSPLAFGLLSGKYDQQGFDPDKGADKTIGRMSMFPQFRAMRYGRPEAWEVGKLYNKLARDHGLTPTAMALAFCYQQWRVASTIIGVTSNDQLDECIAAAKVTLSKEILTAIDALRWQHRDPAL